MITLLVGLLSGCGTAPIRVDDTAAHTRLSGPGDRVAAAARSQLGIPYRYGGTTPRGFDCSGLVRYAYLQAGIKAPRNTGEQRRLARPVPLARLRPGDVLFFRLSWPKVSHVGIYVGGGRFIHAPSSGKRVSYASLDNPYWRKRVVAAGRFY